MQHPVLTLYQQRNDRTRATAHTVQRRRGRSYRSVCIYCGHPIDTVSGSTPRRNADHVTACLRDWLVANLDPSLDADRALRDLTLIESESNASDTRAHDNLVTAFLDTYYLRPITGAPEP